MSPTEAGLAMVPFTVGILIVAIIATRIIHQTGHYKWIPVGGAFLMLTGVLLLSRIQYDSPLWKVFGAAVIFGGGLGGLMQPLMLAVQNSLPARDNGAGTASVMFFRQIGGSLGTAVFLSLLFGSVQERIANAFKAAAQTPAFQAAISDPAVLADPKSAAVIAAVTSNDPTALQSSGISLDDTSFIHDLTPQLAAPFQIGFAQAIAGVMLVAAAFIVIALVAIFFLPSLPLQDKSGLQAMADEAEGAPDVSPKGAAANEELVAPLG
jgi:hypothetical protein